MPKTILFLLFIKPCYSDFAYFYFSIAFFSPRVYSDSRKMPEKKRSLVSYTALIVSIIFIIAIIVLSVMVLQAFSGEMQQRIIEDKQAFSVEIAGSINDIFENLTVPIVSLSIDNATQRLLRDQAVRYSPDWLLCIRNIDDNLRNALLFNSHIVDIAIVRADSTVVYSYASVLDRDYDFCNATWFQDALKLPGLIKYAPPHGNDHYYRQRQGKLYVFTSIFPIVREGRVLGYVLYEVDISRMSHIFNRETGGEGFLLIGTDDGIIFDYRNGRTSAELSTISAYLDSFDGSARVMGDKLFIGQRLSSTGWFILSETDMQIISDPLRRIVLLAIAVLIVAVVLILLLVTRVAKQLRIPMNNLIERMANYDGSGAIPLKDTADQYSEIFAIHSKFEEMADKISALIGDVYEEQKLRRDIEFESLMNQINPHFLYNVLQTIQGEAVLAGNRGIEDMVTALAEMLRYGMDRSREEATLQEELAHTEHYLMFYKARFPDLFDYEIQCDAAAGSVPVPKMLIQPLIENCFRHGFGNFKTGRQIKVSAEIVPEGLCIEVWDNGAGIVPEKLSALRQELENTQRVSGIGLANTNTRIRLKYSGSLNIESEAGSFTCVTLHLRSSPGGNGHV
jgi:sensor histidine kinase YesM